MDWSDIGRLAAKAAPLVGTLLGGPAGAAVGGMVAARFGVDPAPDQVAAAIQADPEAALKLAALQKEHERELTAMHLEAETLRLAEVNATMRAEVKSGDGYVRRWRPTFGYMVALSWGLLMAGIVYTMIASPQYAAEVVNAITALAPMWGVALAVLGINITKRSHDKQVAAGQAPPGGLVGAIARRLEGGRLRGGDA